MNITINQENVKELWELYENYRKKFYEMYYSNVKCDSFEEFVEHEVTQCNQCQQYILNDDIGSSELAINDNICINCMEDGYGK